MKNKKGLFGVGLILISIAAILLLIVSLVFRKEVSAGLHFFVTNWIWFLVAAIVLIFRTQVASLLQVGIKRIGK